VADTFNHAIRKITPQGVVTTLAGKFYGDQDNVNNLYLPVKFNYPSGVAVDGSGNVYVADTGNNVIRRITTNGVVSTLAGSTDAGFTNGTGTNARFASPVGVAVDGSGNVYVAEGNVAAVFLGNNAIRKIATNGAVTTLAGESTALRMGSGPMP